MVDTATDDGTRHAEFAPLERLFGATSVALVGASADLNKIGGRPLRYLREAGYRGRVHAVNPRYDDIAGFPCSPDLQSIGESVDLAVIAVAASGVPAAIDQCAEAGIPFAVVFSAGFGELGDDGRRRQDELVERARRGGVRIIGPNSLGVASSPNALIASFATLFDRHSTLLPGRVGFISQSGALGVFMYALAQDQGLGFSRFVSIGNESDLDVADFVAYLARDPETAVIGGYLEGLGDGRRFMRAAALARAAGKPMVFLKVGRSEVGRRAAASHTGSLAGSENVYRAALEQAGVIRVDDPAGLIDLLALQAQPSARRIGPGVAVLTISGGAGVWTADRLADHGVELAEFAPSTLQRLTEALPAFASPQNPLDATGQIVNDQQMFDRCLEALLDDAGVRTVVIILGLQDRTGVQFARQIVAACEAFPEKAVVVAWLAGPRDAIDLLRHEGVPVYEALHTAVDLAAWSVKVAEIAEQAVPADLAQRVIDAFTSPSATGPSVSTEADAKAELARLGIDMPAGRLCRTVAEAVAAVEALGAPVALKAQVVGIAHKTEHALVALNVTAASVASEFEQLLTRAEAVGGLFQGVLVEQMAPAGVDVIVGCVHDEVFGPTMMFGLGGVAVELLGDVSFRIAPVDRDEALRMISEIRSAPLLTGFRGSEPLDIDALADVIQTVSRFATTELGVGEVELNPVRVHRHGAQALDALIVRSPSHDQPSRR